MTGEVDVERLRDLGESLGGSDVLVDLIGIYLEEAPKQLDRMEAAIAEGDADALGLAAHTLKGSSAQLGVPRLSELCRDLEAMGDAGEVAGAEGKVRKAREAFERARSRLEELRDEIGAT